MRHIAMLLAWLALAAMVVLAVVYDPGTVDARVDTTQWLVLPIDQPVSFPLDPGEDAIKLVTWLAAPARWARDTRAWSPFRLHLVVRDQDDEIVWEDVSWRRTRTSWIRRRDGALLRPAWMPQSRLEVSDNRLNLVSVAGLVPKGGRLEVQADSPRDGATVFVAAFRHAWRTKAAQLRSLAGAESLRDQAPVERVTEEGWDSLPGTWQQRLAERLWERISHLPGASGKNLATTQLRTAAISQPWETQAALGLALQPGAAAAFNVYKGAVLQADWRDLSGRRAAAAPTWLQLVHADGTSEVSFLGVVSRVGPLIIDEPLVSVQIALDPRTEGARVLQASLPGGRPASMWGTPPLIDDSDQARWLLAPDLRSIVLSRTGPELAPVRIPVHRDGELIRLTLRPRMDIGQLPAFGLYWDPTTNTTAALPPPRSPPVLVTVTARDAAGDELNQWQTAAPAVASAFERYSQGDDPGTARCSEPAVRILVPPAGTATLDVQASAPLDIGARAFDPDAPPRGLARDYDLPTELSPPITASSARRLPAWAAGRLRQVRGFSVARYEPYSQDPWRTRAPLDRDQLIEEDRLVRLDAQVRFGPASGFMVQQTWMSEEPVTIDDALPARQARRRPRNALPLDGPYQLVVEPDRDGRLTAGVRTLISATATRVQVPASGRLDLDYRVAPAQAGDTVEVMVDGTGTRRRLLSSAGRLRLANLTPGPHRVRVSSSGLFLARTHGDRPWQVRRVVRLDAGQTRRITIPGGPNSVAIYSYGQQGWLEWHLFGGSQAPGPAMTDRATLRFGRQRLIQEGGSARALSFWAGQLQRLTPLVVDVSTDMGQEPLSLELSLKGTAQPVWIRATATWARTPAAQAKRSQVVDR